MQMIQTELAILRKTLLARLSNLPSYMPTTNLVRRLVGKVKERGEGEEERRGMNESRRNEGKESKAAFWQ